MFLKLNFQSVFFHTTLALLLAYHYFSHVRFLVIFILAPFLLNLRKIIKLNISHPDWDFLKLGPKDKNNQPTPPNNADFAIKAYGGKCGKIKVENLQELRPKSWHWFKSNIEKDELIHRFNQLDYSDSLNTARQNSMGRGELVRLYSNFINSKL